MSAPVAVVGASWRTANTALRAELAALGGSAEPIASLRRAGYVSGAACISTCSRTEWVLTADQPEWAASLFHSALAARAPSLEPRQLMARTGPAAVHYLLRVTVGLDSVAEGEASVGRQVLRGFERARATSTSDARLNRVWRHVERLLHARRAAVPPSRSLGVQALVRAALLEHAPHRVAILGRGDFGQSMERSLRALSGCEVSTWGRQSVDALLDELPTVDALVVCTGASHAWLNLPPRQRPGLCIDAGAPAQVLVAPGWTHVGLDALLARPELQLDDGDRLRLEGLVEAAQAGLTAEFDAPAPAGVLAAIDAERAAFLNERLPGLLAGLSQRDARRVRQAVGAFTHRLMRMTREAP